MKIDMESQILEDIASLGQALACEDEHATKYNARRNMEGTHEHFMAGFHLRAARWWRTEAEAWMRIMEGESY